MQEPQTNTTPILLNDAKWAFATRRVQRSDAVDLDTRFDQARSGDLLLARVEQIGSHRRLQLIDGRPAGLYPGDLIVAAVGARYASDQFEGTANIDAVGADLLAGGGCIGKMRQRHANMKRPTRVVPVGLLTDHEGQVINLERYAMATSDALDDVPAIGVVGASMNAGKTTAVAALVHGLRRAGYRVAAIKATGTGAFGDYNAYVDAGAHHVGDFTDTGMVSTYLQPISRLEHSLDALLAAARQAGCEVAVVEFADGVLQRETAALLGRPAVRSRFAGFVYAVPDALAAMGGCQALGAIGITPAALTGLISASPLNVSEAEQATGLPVLSREALADPAPAGALLHAVTPQARPRIAA